MENVECRSSPARSSEGFDRQRLRALLGHVPGFCYTTDRDLVFTSSQGAGLVKLGLHDDQVVGSSLTALWGTDDPDYEPHACHRKALDGAVQTYRDVCMGRSLEYRITPLCDDAGDIVGVLGVGIDVTEREQARDQEAKLVAQLRQAQKMESIGQLAGGVAHDFNNLLTCILGNLTLAERFLADPARASKHIVEAGAAAESAATLTRQLLAYGRKQLIDPRPTDIGALVRRVQGMLSRLIGPSIALHTVLGEDLWVVRADPGQLEQVLLNLVVNARDAIDDHGEITVRTHNADLSAATAALPPSLEPGRYVVLTVSDSGRGMSEAVRAKLFEPFFTTKELGKGTGLGLAMVYGAARQNRGTVTVDSDLGQGSSFHVYLPVVNEVAHEEAAPDSSLGSPSASLPHGQETILLVEDEPLLLELAHCSLQQLGYQVLPCASADEALRVFGEHQQHIQLLFTDVMMPRMNGKELAARIRAHKPDTRVLYSSGFGESVIATDGVVDASIHYIAKPYRLGELALKLREVLDAAHGPDRASGAVAAGAPERVDATAE